VGRHLEVHAQDCEVVAERVVKIARDAEALGFAHALREELLRRLERRVHARQLESGSPLGDREVPGAEAEDLASDGAECRDRCLHGSQDGSVDRPESEGLQRDEADRSPGRKQKGRGAGHGEEQHDRGAGRSRGEESERGRRLDREGGDAPRHVPLERADGRGDAGHRPREVQPGTEEPERLGELAGPSCDEDEGGRAHHGPRQHARDVERPRGAERTDGGV
jgi:hypothetical protein